MKKTIRLRVVRVEEASPIIMRHGSPDRYKVTLSDNFDSTCTYLTGEQPAVGDTMTLEITPEAKS